MSKMAGIFITTLLLIAVVVLGLALRASQPRSQ
jgi:hypothetical protein